MPVLRRPRVAIAILSLSLVFGSSEWSAAESRAGEHEAGELPTRPVQVWLLAGQSNMVGSDARAADIDRYPPFVGVGAPRDSVRYRYLLERGGRTVDKWVSLAPVDGGFGPELTFAREMERATGASIAIVKSAVGGTTLAVDWDPEAPSRGLRLFPKTVALVKSALADLRARGVSHELAGVLWHQGENDMLDRRLVTGYRERLVQLIARFRLALDAPRLPFYIGEISHKGIWGMDFRRNMKTLRDAQLEVVSWGANVHWVPTSHVAFAIMGSGQPHYHFGTLGQLQHGLAYAETALSVLGPARSTPGLAADPIKPGETVRVFLLLGQRNVDGEEAWVDELAEIDATLVEPDPRVLYHCSLGGGVRESRGFEALGPPGFLSSFGPQLSLGRALRGGTHERVAIVQVSDGGALLFDWEPVPTVRANRPIYGRAVSRVNAALGELRAAGAMPRLEAVFWSHGENETYFAPFRQTYPARLRELITRLREDLAAPGLPWFVSLPSSESKWGAERVREMHAALTGLARAESGVFVVASDSLPHGDHFPETRGTVALGAAFAEAYLASPGTTRSK